MRVAEVTFSEDLDGYEKVQRTQQLVRKTWFNDEICWNDQDEIDEPEDLEYLVAVSSCKPDMLICCTNSVTGLTIKQTMK